MILLLDIGNTRIKWSQLLNGALTPQQAILHQDVAAEEWQKQLFRERFRPTRLIVANVAGADMAGTVRTEAKRAWKVEPEFAITQAHAGGVTNAYRETTSLGVDRWLAMLGARKLAGAAAVCVIDAGTAVTFDAVNAAGLHLGGLIVPGVQTMIDSLLDRTGDIARLARSKSSLPAANTSGQSSVLAASTAQAVAQGALLAVAAGMDRAVAEVEKKAGPAPRVLITGGDAERVQKAMQARAEIVPDLVLRGLAVQCAPDLLR